MTAKRKWWDRYAVPAGLLVGFTVAALIDLLWVPGGMW